MKEGPRGRETMVHRDQIDKGGPVRRNDILEYTLQSQFTRLTFSIDRFYRHSPSFLDGIHISHPRHDAGFRALCDTHKVGPENTLLNACGHRRRARAIWFQTQRVTALEFQSERRRFISLSTKTR